MMVFDSHNIEQIAASSVRSPTMETCAEDSAYRGGTPVWGLALGKGLQSESYLLVTSPTPSKEQAEGREARDVNGTDLMPVRVIESMQPGHRKPIKVLSGKQTNALRDEMRSFVDENMGIAVLPSTAFLREINHEGIESLAVRCGGNPVIRGLPHTLLTVFHKTID